MIQVRQISKSFGPVQALDSVDFTVPSGEVVGLLGRNGAGKSTALRIITGYLPPDAGDVTIGDVSVVSDSIKARRQIGYLPESTPTYGEMRVDEYLHYLGKLHGMSRADRRRRIDELTPTCALEKIRRRLIGGLSKGNRQRVGLAQALIHEPKIVVLDEPTSGLDPQQTQAFRQLLDGLRGRHTVVLSSHLLPEVERSADRVIVLDGGKVRAVGTPSELRDRASRGATVVVEVKSRVSHAIDVLQKVSGVAKVELEDHGDPVPAKPQAAAWVRLRVTPKGSVDVRQAVASAAATAGLPIRELTRETSMLERFFDEDEREVAA